MFGPSVHAHDLFMAARQISFRRDLGLQIRMLLTIALLGLLYVVLIVVLLAAGVGTVLMLVVVAGLAAAQLFLSDKLALRAIGAREVSAREAPDLHAIVERLCVQADLPKPRIAIADTLRTRILLADDHTAVRSGLRLLLDIEPELEVVAEAGDGAAAVEEALADDVDLARLDITMPRITGLQAASELARRRPELRILILSIHASEQCLFEALRAGACGYDLKSRADRDLVEACRAAMRGEPFPYPGAVPTLSRDHLEGANAGDAPRADPLTSRPRFDDAK